MPVKRRISPRGPLSGGMERKPREATSGNGMTTPISNVRTSPINPLLRAAQRAIDLLLDRKKSSLRLTLRYGARDRADL